MSAAASHPKLRILCLHGYRGSARTLRSQAASLADAIAPLAELVFIDAPSLASGDYGWWHAVDAERDSGDDPGVVPTHRHYKGWARTRAAIVEAFATQGPFDGVLGFSQGAALTGVLTGLRAPDRVATPERPLVFELSLLVSGFPANDRELAQLYARTDSYALPSLHIVGRTDGIVPIEASRALAAHFANPTIVEHGGGHVIPSSRDVHERVRDFLQARITPASLHPIAP